MQQHLSNIPFVGRRMTARAVERFLGEKESKGVFLRNEDAPQRLCRLRTVLIDDTLIMQGDNAVRQIAAPVEICRPEALKRQRAWMMLTAGISLAGDGWQPLEHFAGAQGFTRSQMMRQYPRIDCRERNEGQPFDVYVHRDAAGMRVYIKGDVRVLLKGCDRLLNGHEALLTPADRDRILCARESMETDGLETIGFATGIWDARQGKSGALCFLGLVGLGDLPHPGAPQAMEALREAGIRPVLAYGGEAKAGAVRASGVLRERAGIMDAREMDALTDAALREAAEHADAYLGMDWQRKRRLTRAMRADGTVATLSVEPETGGMVLAIGGGPAPDVIFQHGGVQALIRLLSDCRELAETYKLS